MYFCVVVANEIVNKVTQMKIILGVESAKYSLGNVSNQGFIRHLVCRNVVLFSVKTTVGCVRKVARLILIPLRRSVHPGCDLS